MRKCFTCKIEKSYAEFYKEKREKDGYNYQCKLCIKQYQIKNAERIREYNKQRWKEYYQKNAITIKQQKKDYAKTENGKLNNKVKDHKHRAFIKNNTVGKHFTTNDLIIKLKLQHSKCVYCQTSIKDYYEVDHFIPLCKGGSNESFNIQLLCQNCNRGVDGKGSKLPHEFAQQHGKLI